MAAIFEDSVSGVIPVAVDKIDKLAEGGSPRLGVNEVGFLLDFFNNSCIIKLITTPCPKNKPIYHAWSVNR